MDEKRPPGFTVYKNDFKQYANMLGESDLGEVFRALYLYSIGEEYPEPEDKEAYAAFRVMKTKIDIDAAKYESKCNTNKENSPFGK